MTPKRLMVLNLLLALLLILLLATPTLAEIVGPLPASRSDIPPPALTEMEAATSTAPVSDLPAPEPVTDLPPPFRLVVPTPMIDLTPLFQVLIGLLATLISTKLWPWITARTNMQQRELIMATVRTLVYAAEQMYQTKLGEEKLYYVEKELKQRGYTVDRAMIEAAVREMNLTRKWLATELIESSTDVVFSTE